MSSTRRPGLLAASAVLVSCTGAHTAPMTRGELCRTLASGPIVMQTTAEGECAWASVHPLEGMRPPNEDFVVTGPYVVEGFGVIRSPCDFPRRPVDDTVSMGNPVGVASTTVDESGTHLVIRATVDYFARPPYPAITRDVNVDVTFREEDIILCE